MRGKKKQNNNNNVRSSGGVKIDDLNCIVHMYALIVKTESACTTGCIKC